MKNLLLTMTLPAIALNMLASATDAVNGGHDRVGEGGIKIQPLILDFTSMDHFQQGILMPHFTTSGHSLMLTPMKYLPFHHRLREDMQCMFV